MVFNRPKKPSHAALSGKYPLRANVYISGGSVNTIAVNRVNLVTYSPNQPGNNMVNLRQGDSLQMAYSSVTLTWQFL